MPAARLKLDLGGDLLLLLDFSGLIDLGAACSLPVDELQSTAMRRVVNHAVLMTAAWGVGRQELMSRGPRVCSGFVEEDWKIE